MLVMKAFIIQTVLGITVHILQDEEVFEGECLKYWYVEVIIRPCVPPSTAVGCL